MLTDESPRSYRELYTLCAYGSRLVDLKSGILRRVAVIETACVVLVGIYAPIWALALVFVSHVWVLLFVYRSMPEVRKSEGAYEDAKSQALLAAQRVRERQLAGLQVVDDGEPVTMQGHAAPPAMLDAEKLQRIADEAPDIEDRHGALVLIGPPPQPTMQDRIAYVHPADNIFVSPKAANRLAGLSASTRDTEDDPDPPKESA